MNKRKQKTSFTPKPSVSIPKQANKENKSGTKRQIANDSIVKPKKSKLKLTDNPDQEISEVSVKVVKFSGIVPVDSECKLCIDNYQIYSNGTNVYNAMLNQTNVGQNNNKYYLLQLLKHKSKSDYCVWFRWGRVGKIAGTNLQHLNLNDAICTFEKKFKDKTNNLWAERNTFTKFPQKYDLLQLDYGEKKLNVMPDKPLKNEVPSKLHSKVQEVMKFLFDIVEFEQTVKEMQYDVKKAPLGKLTEKQIKAGYLSLKKVEKHLKTANFGKALQNACSEFYTRIPHDFGMKRPPLIHSLQEMKLKLHLLEALSDIKIAISVMDQAEKDQPKENSLDIHYKSLNCSLTPVSKTENEYQIVQQYVQNTHASTHSNYKLEIETLFQIKKPQLANQFREDLGTRMLLWHGSRMMNWCGILKEGLKIAPPEAPSTGYMFGKGIYLADMVSKSANYCFATNRQPVGFLLLCEVALGSMCDKTDADYDADKLPSGKNSTRGLGKTIPDPTETLELKDGTVVPLGKPVANSNAKNSSLLYNEYVVYNVNQVKPRFLVQVRFIFTNSW